MTVFSRDDSHLDLTYCLNVHPSYTLDNVRESIQRYTIPLRHRLDIDGPMGLGLRLSFQTVKKLRNNPDELDEFRAFLRENNFYVFTLNAFPAGKFQDDGVKEEVYRPTWLEEDRVQYTKWAGNLLVQFLEDTDRDFGTVSTLPGTFREWGDSDRTWNHILGNFLRMVYHFHKKWEETGNRIQLCIEPEPFCSFESTDDILRFFNEFLFENGIRQYLDAFEMTEDEARKMITDHLGICFDASHLSVQYEQLPESLDRIQQAGIDIGKMQISAAPALLSPSRKPEAADSFLKMAEDRFLHQTYGQDAEGTIHSIKDLSRLNGDRLEEWEQFEEWRTHFHVPVFVERMENILTTQEFLQEGLKYALEETEIPHFEIETYSWNVLPITTRSSLGITNLTDVLEKEFDWTREQIREAGYRSGGQVE